MPLYLEEIVPPEGEEPVMVPCDEETYEHPHHWPGVKTVLRKEGTRPVRYKVRAEVDDSCVGRKYVIKGMWPAMQYTDKDSIIRRCIKAHRAGDELPGVTIEEVSCD